MPSRGHKIVTGVVACRVATGTGVGCAETRTLKVNCLGVVVDPLDRNSLPQATHLTVRYSIFAFQKLTAEEDSQAYRNFPRRSKAWQGASRRSRNAARKRLARYG